MSKSWLKLVSNYKSCLSLMTLLILGNSVVVTVSPAVALPPPEDIPEEVLRTEIILGARSPIDGKPLSAADYAALQAEWAVVPPQPLQVSRGVRKTINLLKLRKFLKTFAPFVPIK
jgi:ribosomal protein L30/L7E